MDSEKGTAKEIDEVKQNQRAILREKFLKMLKQMENKKLTIQTYNGACVNGTFRSCDYDILNVHVSNLHTPIGTVPEALVRVNDIVFMKFSLDSQSLHN